MVSFPGRFGLNEKEEAEFWGWLTGRFPVPAVLFKDLENHFDTDDNQLFLFTREHISSLVEKAFRKNDSKTAQNLFELTKPVDEDKEYVRKSMRIGTGEYFELLYLKLKKDTSFSDILIDVLSNPMLDYINELKKQYGDILSDKLKIMYDTINNWRKITPESRSRNIEYNYIKFENKPMPFLPNLDQSIIDELINYAKIMSYLENLPYDIIHGPDHIYLEFKEKWDGELEKQLKSGILMDIYIDNQNSVKLSFKLYVTVPIEVDRLGLEELYLKYDFIDNYLKKYCLYPDTSYLKSEFNKYKDYPKKFIQIIENLDNNIYIGYTVNISKYFINVESDKKFNIIHDNNHYKKNKDLLKNNLKEIISELRNNYEYTSRNDLIQKIMTNGNKKDYDLVSLLFSIENAIKYQIGIYEFGQYLIENEVIKYPVISYYIPKNLTPLLSIILKTNLLYNLIMKYKKENT